MSGDGLAPASASSEIFARLLGVSDDVFLATYFTRSTFHGKGAVPESLLASLPTIRSAPQMVARLSDRARAVRIAEDGAAVPAATFANGSVDQGTLWQRYSEGCSIVLNNIQKVDEGVKAVCDDLMFASGHEATANAYLTPANARVFPTHYDVHDVVVVQLHGSKRWHLYERPSCVPAFPNDKVAPDVDSELLESGAADILELEVGSALYVPRGTPHRVHAVDCASFHLTFGLRPVSHADVLRKAIDILEREDPLMRSAAGLKMMREPAFDPGLRDAAQRLVEAARAPEIAARTANAIRQQTLRNASLVPDMLAEGREAGARIKWRCSRFHQIDAEQDRVILSNGLRATAVDADELLTVTRLRAGEVVTLNDRQTDLASRLFSMGLIETAEVSDSGER